MKYFTTILFTALLAINFNFAQNVQVHYESSPVFTSDLWATDILVSGTEPFGKLTGIAKTNGTIYFAVPDTAITSGRCIVVFRSTDLGESWTNFATVSPASVEVPRMRMVRSGLDSVYLFFLFGTTVYCWNVENNNFNSLTGICRDFDAVASSTGGVYVFQDILGTNSIPRLASVNGFATVSQTATVTSAGAHPRVYMSGTGDTLILNYYGPVLADTMTSIIRSARYRESAAGTLASIAFIDVATETQTKSEFQAVRYGNVVWFIYTLGTTGNIDIKCRISNDGGTTFGSPVTLAGNPNTDEYWFEARHYTTGTAGLDIVYYSDSLQSGNPTNNTDKMLYSYSNLTSPGTFSTPEQFSEHPPGWSARGYIPAVIELYNTSDVGAAWVGLDGSNKKVYWDRYLAVTGVPRNQNQIPGTYRLKQNYPNPFNPVTKIEFSLPKDDFVTIKVFDILGSEVAELVSKNIKAGSYEVAFDGSKLSSGVYFCRMQAGLFSQTKKMLLVK
jgi:hypothetical protein